VNEDAPLQPLQHETRLDDGLPMAWFEWPAAPAMVGAPTILLVHATGFHARCWDAVVERLGGPRVVAVDMRGHGRTGKTGPVAWDRFGDDLTSFVRATGLEGAVGVGHSMGGFCVTYAAAFEPEAFSRLVLVDPVILPPEAYAARAQWIDGDEHPTARRRDRWSAWQEMYERFEDRMPFASWEKRVLEDYCRHGVLPAADGEGFVLACPPRIEASIYIGSAGRDIHDLVEQVEVPVTVLRAKSRSENRDPMDFSSSPTWVHLAERFPDARDVHLADRSHFVPMEAPQLTAEFILGTR
jgi:pimeloyl-ACP methyl ester carboxylesterase